MARNVLPGISKLENEEEIKEYMWGRRNKNEEKEKRGNIRRHAIIDLNCGSQEKGRMKHLSSDPPSPTPPLSALDPDHPQSNSQPPSCFHL